MMLLDEPTNHLDIEAIDSLAEAIKSFKVRGQGVRIGGGAHDSAAQLAYAHFARRSWHKRTLLGCM
jgi:ABC-type cobalamin/Fe3+-siderophores transport system ATPase subunit